MTIGVQSKDNFVNYVATIALTDAHTVGLHVVSPVIAQAIIESNWGESGLAKKGNNLFGIKCGSSWKGASINMKTKEEYTPGTLTTISDNFRKYSSWEESIHDYFKFISTKRYKKLFSCKTALEYCTEIRNAGYATSSTYIATLMNCINKYKLADYDVALSVYDVPNNEDTTTTEYVETPVEHITSVIDYSKVVSDVINGLYGSGDDRILRLSHNGYNPLAVQYMVNLQVKLDDLTKRFDDVYNIINKVKEALQ